MTSPLRFLRRLDSTDWKVIALLVVIAVAFLAKCASAEQCFPSLEAARAVNPIGHVSWTDRGGHRQFYAGYPKAGVKCDVPTERQVVRSDTKKSKRFPESRPRPATSLAGAARETPSVSTISPDDFRDKLLAYGLRLVAERGYSQ